MAAPRAIQRPIASSVVLARLLDEVEPGGSLQLTRHVDGTAWTVELLAYDEAPIRQSSLGASAETLDSTLVELRNAVKEYRRGGTSPE